MSHSTTNNTCEDSPLSLNGVTISHYQSSVTISVDDQTVELSINRLCNLDTTNTEQSPYQALFFDIIQIDGILVDSSAAFSVVLSPSKPVEILLEPTFDGPTHCGFLLDTLHSSSDIFGIGDNVSIEANNQDEPESINGETEDKEFSPPHKDLRRRLQDQKRLMRQITMECQKKLIDDLEACHHDIACSGKAICRHLHDAIRNLLSNVRSLLQGSAMVSQQRQQYQEIVFDEKKLNITTTTSYSASSASVSNFDLDPRNPIVIALEILFGVLGLGGLCAFIRRRCCSLRYRVERLANREERQRARHYRQLARKEALRKKWVAVKSVFSKLPCRNSNYEEKRALILEAAAVATQEQYLECGGSSSAVYRQVAVAGIHDEITDLRYAHEIVTALLQAEQGTAAPVTAAVYMHDTRSRSSSLPSYNSENLPSYTSQPENNSDSGSDVIVVRDGFRPYSPSSISGASFFTAVTPESSIPDLSPRCSGDTLRTDFSRG